MTDLADLPFNDPDWPPAPVVEREPRKCRRHRWFIDFSAVNLATEEGLPVTRCRSCGKAKDEAGSRRGRTSRNRGNAYEREVAEKLGGRRVGQYGDSVDVDVPGWIRVQCKNGGAYPALLDRWLRAIPVQADLLRAVVVGDAPGPGTRRRSLIVLDLDEFASWYGRK
jgi:hypothetical protein